MIIGSRGSQLALYQAELVAKMMSDFGIPTEIEIIKTVGDKIDHLSFDKIEGKGFFTRELEEALLDRRIDLAVHSLKDLPTELPPGLTIGGYCSPEDSSELMLIRPESFKPMQRLNLAKNATVGTSSVRREAQLKYHRPDIVIEPLRGNVPTRIKKLQEEMYDAIILARAGVKRLDLDLSDLKAIILNKDEFLPAPGQGILAIEIRENDNTAGATVSRLNSKTAERTARLERGLLAHFQGGCQLPLAVTSDISGNKMTLKAFLGRRDGNRWLAPSFYKGSGDDIDKLIEDAYIKLTA